MEVLQQIAKQKLSTELDPETEETADYQGAYDIMINMAREAIQQTIP